MSVAWPSDVPFFHADGPELSEPQDALLRTSMDSGPDKVRPRTTAAVELYSGQTSFMTRMQFLTFRAFYRNDLSFGALPFAHADPFEGSVRNFRFLSYTVRKTGAKFRISAELEILP